MTNLIPIGIESCLCAGQRLITDLCSKYEGTTPTVLTRTVQVCVGELFSKIDASVKLPDEPDTTEESGDTMGVRNDGGTPEVDASSIKNPFSAAASDQVITGGKYIKALICMQTIMVTLYHVLDGIGNF